MRHIDDPWQSYREAWASLPDWLGALSALAPLRTHPTAGPQVNRALGEAAAARDRHDPMAEASALASVCVHGLSHGDAGVRLAALHLLDGRGEREGLERAAAAVGALLADPDPRVACAAARWAWFIRRGGRAPLATLAAPLRDALARAHGEHRVFLVAAALHGAAAAERPALLAELRAATLPERFEHGSRTGALGDVSCRRAPIAEPRNDGGEPRHTGRHCVACGDPSPAIVHHELTTYSIGILETTAVECASCHFTSVHEFAT